MFDGWFDENGNRMQNTQTINADQTYTARFIPIGLSDDNILAMPDARGTVGSDGSGKVSVSGANENRFEAVYATILLLVHYYTTCHGTLAR